jgi:hypothetical protein
MGKYPAARVAGGWRRFLLVAPLSALLSSHSATLVALNVPDRQGMFADILPGLDTLLGFDTAEFRATSIFRLNTAK